MRETEDSWGGKEESIDVARLIDCIVYFYFFLLCYVCMGR